MNPFEIFTGVFGGLGLFLYGMHLMSEGLESVAGTRLKTVLEKVTSNRIIAVFIGAIVTAVIQSSSATTVMVVSFVNAGLMNLIQAAGVIMGANIGTTITAQMVSFRLDDIAPLFVGLGAVIILLSKNKKVRDIAYISLGFGILFLGMGSMSGALKPIAQADWFKEFVIIIGDNVFLGILTGLVMTAVVQSSSATTGILVAFATTGAITLKVAFPIILGCNIGTCVTALIAGLGGNRTAKKAALIHLFFNIGGAIIFIPFINLVVNIAQSITPDNVARQIANSHTIFNVTVTIIMIPLAKYLVMLANRILPGDEKIKEEGAIYLDNMLIDAPTVAVQQVIKETVRMGKTARENLEMAMEAFIDGKSDEIETIYHNEDLINILEHQITNYLVELSQQDLPVKEANIIASTYHAINDIERIGDHAKNIVELAMEKIKNKLKFDSEALEEVQIMYKETLKSLDMALNNYSKEEVVSLGQIAAIEKRINNMEAEYRDHNIRRLNNKECHPTCSVIFLDLISNLERIGDHSENIGNARID